MFNTLTIDLTGSYQKLDTIIQAKLAAIGGLPKWPTLSNTLKVVSEKSNVAGTRVQIAGNPNASAAFPGYELLVEEYQEWGSGGLEGGNGVSSLDKYIRIVDNAGAGTTGKAEIVQICM